MPQTYKLALLDDYQKVAMRMADWDRLKKRGVEITVFHEPFASVEDAARKLAPFDMLGLLRERTAFPRALIEKLPNLKFMVLTGARASSLDNKAATERGIPISNTPGGGSNASTAELCWALLMSCARDLAKGERLMRSGGWHDGIKQMVVLEGKRLGVIGLGRLGSRVASGAHQGLRHGCGGVEPEPDGGEGSARRRKARRQGRASADLRLHHHPSGPVGP